MDYKRSRIDHDASDKPRRVKVSRRGKTLPRPNGALPLSQLSEQFGMGVDTVRRALLACGHEPGRTSRFTVREVFEAVSGAGLLKTAKARESAARAEMLELKTSERRGDVMRTSDVEDYLAKHIQPLREAMNAMPSQLSARVNPTDPHFAHEVLQSWVDQTVEMMRK